MNRDTPIFMPLPDAAPSSETASQPVDTTDAATPTVPLTQQLLNVVSAQGDSTMTADAKNTLATALTGLTVALAAIHNTGVKLGHFGSEDFLEIAENILATTLPALLPAPAAPAAA